MRSFLAIELPSDVRSALVGVQKHFQQAGIRASWVKPENLHLTLRFLGNLEPVQVDTLIAAFQPACALHTTPRLRVAGTGCFPNPRRPTVLWAGVRVEAGNLDAIHACCEAAARAVGLPPETRRFRAHVTFARIRDSRPARALPGLLDTAPPACGDAFTARAVALFKSELNPGGAVYTRLEEFPFQCQRES